MKRLLALLYLLLTLGQVAMDRERPEVFLAELNYFLHDESSPKVPKTAPTPRYSATGCKGM